MTINEIAKMAGVSRTTVSRYLNNGYVSKEKAERIREVIDQTGYRPSRQAQMLRTKQTHLIAVILPKINSDSISREVSGISTALARTGYELILANTNNHESEELKYLRLFAADQSVDGIILIGTILTQEHIRLISSLNLPIVVLGQKTDACACVFYDDYNASKKLTEHLCRTGKEIGFIGVTDRDKAAGEARRHGFQDALKEAGFHISKQNMIRCDFAIDSGYEACRKLLKANPSIDSLFCATDNIAIGAMLYLREIGRSIPDDIQLVGTGDSDKAHVVVPTLTTAHYYYRTSGKETARILLSLLSGLEKVPREVKMGYKIVYGGSTRQIPDE